MVARSNYFRIAVNRHYDRIRGRIRNQSIHLYPVLMKEKHVSTILVFVVVLCILFLVYRNDNFLYAALGVGAIGLFVPWLSKKIHWLWMKFAELLGSVMNKVILSVVFYVFLFPVAMLSRLFRGSTLKAKNVKAASYFTERNFTYDAKSLEQLW